MAKKEEAVETVETNEDGKTRITIPTEKYVDAKSATGGKSKHNGDAVATALSGHSIDSVYGIAAEMTGTAVEDLQAKYAHLNVGQQRMNLGNRIRGAVNKMDADEKAEFSGAEYLAQIADGYEKPELPAKKAAAKEEAEAE